MTTIPTLHSLVGSKKNGYDENIFYEKGCAVFVKNVTKKKIYLHLSQLGKTIRQMTINRMDGWILGELNNGGRTKAP